MKLTALFLLSLIFVFPFVSSFSLDEATICGGDDEISINCYIDSETSVIGDFRTTIEKSGDVTDKNSQSFNYFLYGSIGFVFLAIIIVLIAYDLRKKRLKIGRFK